VDKKGKIVAAARTLVGRDPNNGHTRVVEVVEQLEDRIKASKIVEPKDVEELVIISKNTLSRASLGRVVDNKWKLIILEKQQRPTEVSAEKDLLLTRRQVKANGLHPVHERMFALQTALLLPACEIEETRQTAVKFV
jgi:hypothetical protein